MSGVLDRVDLVYPPGSGPSTAAVRLSSLLAAQEEKRKKKKKAVAAAAAEGGGRGGNDNVVEEEGLSALRGTMKEGERVLPEVGR